MHIGLKIKEIRSQKNYSLRKLAEKSGIHFGSISRIENGLVLPDVSTIKKIAEALNMPINIFLDEKVIHRIPVLGIIPAGIPIEAIEDILDYEEITPEMASKGEYFALKVSGNSMSPKIENNDVVIIKQQTEFNTGDICVVIVNGYDATLKIVKKEPSGITLIGSNPAYPPQYFSASDIAALPVRVIGKAVEIRRTL